MAGKPKLQIARGVGLLIAHNSSGGAAEAIMLLPSGDAGIINTVDGRGPYRVTDPERLIRDSMQAASGRLPIDENHATDLAAPKGGPSPARGWVTALELRNDGIYGRVEWSGPGAQLMSEHAYRFISPVFTHDAAGNISGLLRASLTNTPNLRGMAALHAEGNDMDLLAQLRKILGLADDADEAAVVAKIEKLTTKPEEADAALQAALAPIAKAAGAKLGATAGEIVTVVTALASAKPATDDVVVALQTELKDVTTRLNTMVATSATEKATAYVDGEIAKGRVGVKPLRDHYITMHAADPVRVEKEIGAMPIVGSTGALLTPPAKDGQVSLNADQKEAARVLGIPEDKYLKTLQAEQAA